METSKLKPIPGYLGYFISKRGRVFSVKKGFKEIKVSVNPITKRPQVHVNGNSKPIHRLVALAWIPNPNNYICVCHKDNNVLNNRVSNLYWGTHEMNMQQCVRDGRLRPKGKIPKTPEEIKEIIGDYQRGLTNSEIKEKWDIGVTRLNKLCALANIKKKTGDIRKLSDKQVEELILLYKQGATRLELAKKFNISRAGVGNYLRKANCLKKYEGTA